MTDLPRLKKATDREKITLYFDKETGEIYRAGKQNGWDVSEIVRRAASEALKSARNQLNIKAT